MSPSLESGRTVTWHSTIHQRDFETEEPYLVVNLDEACRRQQLGEGWFPTLDGCTEAGSLDVGQADHEVTRRSSASVPDERKAQAVRDCLEEEISPAYPASILRRHEKTIIYLDSASAGLLKNSTTSGEDAMGKFHYSQSPGGIERRLRPSPRRRRCALGSSVSIHRTSPPSPALLNDPSNPNHVPGARVVAAYKGGSPDIESSATRIDKFTTELQTKWNVELVGSIEELCRKVDAVLLESVDGRPHLDQVRPVLAAGKRVFIDKPFAGSYRDAREIVRLAKESGTPFFSTSSLRFVSELQEMKKSDKLGAMLGAFTFSPPRRNRTIRTSSGMGFTVSRCSSRLMGPAVRA
jgi:hypothetical protein